MDKVHKPSDSECYTPSSEPFIFNLTMFHTTYVFREIHGEAHFCLYKFHCAIRFGRAQQNSYLRINIWLGDVFP
jgi:hypothetical protein